MKDPIKPLIAILAVMAIGLIFAFLLTNDSSEVIEDSDADSPSVASTTQTEPQPRGPKPREGLNSPDPEPKKSATDFDEDDIAIPVGGNPLVVTLLNYPELGQISIEGSTGKPLKSGTKVQISDPNNKGEKIQFIVP